MRGMIKEWGKNLARLTNKINLRLRPKLLLIFLVVKVIPIILLTVIAWTQFMSLANLLRGLAVTDSTDSLNDIARENLERLTTDTAKEVAEFLSQRDQDILLLASMPNTLDAYSTFSDNRKSLLMTQGEWTLSEDKSKWVEVDPYQYSGPDSPSTNMENNDELHGSSYNSRNPEFFSEYRKLLPLYDEVTFIDLNGQEVFKYVNPASTKTNYPMNPSCVDISNKMNTYVRAETYWEELKGLGVGDIYVSNVIGAYVGTNFIGMYTPDVLSKLPENPASGAPHPNRSELVALAALPEAEFIEAAKKQAYAGYENPVGQRFEGIVRWATPVTDESGTIIGYATMALNHDHIMEFVDYITPMTKRYTVLPSATDGNYAFMWDYECRNIVHPRHHSIVGYSPITGEPQVPWLEGSNQLERDSTGAFVLDSNKQPRTLRDFNGVILIAKDTPFYFWNENGGAQWLEEYPSWDTQNLSVKVTGVNWWEWEAAGTPKGTSWGTFYAENVDNRIILPQFGERVLRNSSGLIMTDMAGNFARDFQSRSKTPARALTKAGYVGLDGRYLNNAPQCTGWMDLTENGGSGSFYIYWSNLYKPSSAGAIPYYTGQYAPERQEGSRRGFAIVTIGAGIEDFTAPAIATGEKLSKAISDNSGSYAMQLLVTSLSLILFVVLVAMLLATSLTSNIEDLISGISRFRRGDRRFRMNSTLKDEFGMLADSFDEMAEGIETSVNAPLVILNMDHSVIYMNNVAQRLAGRQVSDVTDTVYSDISIYPAASVYDPVTALNDGRDADVYHWETNGHYYKGAANYLTDNAGEKIGYIVVTNDVSEIEDARQKAEQGSAAKSIFLSNMSHEIRTPLNAIIGMTSIGTASGDLEKKDYALGKIADASKHLLGIINDVLDVSKIEANKFDLSETEFELRKMIDGVIDVINVRVAEKHQELAVHIDSNIPPVLVGDDQRLAQVITNLLSNAVKFTPEYGRIGLEITQASLDNGVCTLHAKVSDSGIGVSKEQQGKLFVSFEQAEASTSRKYGGTGLGLVICKSIVEMMNGRIWIDSDLGKGSVFSFTVCLACGEGEHIGPESGAETGEAEGGLSGNFEGHCILLAEDVDINREIVVTLLEPTLLEIDCAVNGLEAVEAFSKNPLKYDMIFMDIQMPEMDGFTATRKIRESGLERAREIPIVAMTANAFKEDIEKCLEAGMNAHIGKPLEFDKVMETLERILSNS